ncbi:MAG: hypothetical protein HC905_20045, partial [Bacteroidales bacterium]|nr:hypothetical protein [Bacteroidales bacterium]
MPVRRLFTSTSDITTYLEDLINDIMGNSAGSTFQESITMGTGGTSCTYCGCIPEGTSELIQDPPAPDKTYYYPSTPCLELFKDCGSFSGSSCSNGLTATIHSGNTYKTVGNDRYYNFPKYLTENCIGCYLKFFTSCSSTAGSINYAGIVEIPYSVLGSGIVLSTTNVQQTGPRKYVVEATTCPFITNYSLSDYDPSGGCGGNTKVYVEIDLSGCPSSVVCEEETVYTLNITQPEFDYSSWYSDCVSLLYSVAQAQADEAFDLYIQDLASQIMANMQCLDNLNESMVMTYDLREHHYTLYYYDQAGNLVQTVPPAGVDVLDNSHFSASGNTIVWDQTSPDHTFITRYQYSSLNQPIEQLTPDGGLTAYYYDDKGRITHSQHAQQRFNK